MKVSPLQLMRNPIGDQLPDTPLVDDSGRNVLFLTDLVKDRAVVITFFYTNCRGTCPGTNLVLAELRDLLARDFGRSVRLISISFEPEKDDVKAIAEYAAQFRVEATDADTPEWLFLTGGSDDIRELRRALQLYSLDEAVDRDPSQHAAAVIVGNHATGRWGILPVGLGAERLAERIRVVAGWTAAQRYP
ncbi:MAG: SCO family protein, partial [Planctomycetia bacterium]|nr:SCO family protein [Planctomycetia bacterium]